MNQKTSFILFAITCLSIALLASYVTGSTADVAAAPSGSNTTGLAGNVTSGFITPNSTDNTGSTGTLLGNCGYSPVPTSTCGTTGSGN